MTFKNCLITGGSQGIGASLAFDLAAQGNCVYVIARNIKKLESLKKLNPTKINIIKCDINCPEDRDVVCNTLKNVKLDYLVNNVGTLGAIKNLVSYTQADLDKIFRTNIISPMLLTNALVKNIVRGGKILNITTVAANAPAKQLAAYSITKSAVNMWTQSLRLELDSLDIAVSSAIPGEVDTDMQQYLRSFAESEFPLTIEFQKAYDNNTLVSPEVVAKFLGWLLNDVALDKYKQKAVWNIYDKNCIGCWIGGEKLPMPYNVDKLS